MEIFYSKKKLQDYIERQKEMGKKIGFAPTMGALHMGRVIDLINRKALDFSEILLLLF